MSHVQTLVRIVLPQTLLTTASASISRLTAIIKSSTLVSVITVPNLIFQSQRIVNRYYGPPRDLDRDRRGLHRDHFYRLLVRKCGCGLD